jgi:hypothetical protein
MILSPPMKIAHYQIFARFHVTMHRWLEIGWNLLVKLQFYHVEVVVACMEHVCRKIHRFLGLQIVVVHEQWDETLELAVHLSIELNR